MTSSRSADKSYANDPFTITLVEDGAKPQIWFTGEPYQDPILLIFETSRVLDNADKSSGIAIVVYNNMDWMKKA